MEFCLGTIFVVMLIIAFVQISRTNRTVADIEQELARLRVEVLKRTRREEPVEEPPAPEPIVEPVVEPLMPSVAQAPPEPIPVIPPPPPPPPPITPPPPVPSKPFDWENLIGVKLFSWIAGVALVLAAVFFLKYSVEHGWLSPTVRATLGLITGIALLVVCELRMARNYPVTANALDGAGIAILYSTLFAMHALWHLLPSSVVFFLMLIVTAVAVLLSIRRDSVYIALLGLMGGFATPALLSTGENRPIGLFSYLLLLNLGLAWVAYRKGWPVLTFGSLIFTVIYQWAWIAKFLTVSQLPLAAVIFAVFAVAGSSALWTRSVAATPTGSRLRFDKIALATALMPLAFAIFGAAVPAYGTRYNVLFAFLLFMTAGLAAIAIWRGPEWLHALGAVATLLTFSIWFAVSYTSNAWPMVLVWVAVFVLLYLAVGMKLDSPASFAPAALLFVFPVLAIREPATESPAVLFATLFVLLALIAAFAITRAKGPVYFLAAFFAIITEAIWSAKHLTSDRLLSGLALYGMFALLFLAVPAIARRVNRSLQPDWGVSATVILSLCVLLFLTADGVAAGALFGLSLLLAIIVVGAFIESTVTVRPYLSTICVLLGWIVLASWWEAAPLTESLIPALVVIAIFGLVVLLASIRADRVTKDEQFGVGTHLALIGHFFLMFVASRDDLAYPPWPLFAVLLVLDLAAGVGALYLRRATLVAGAAVLSQVVLMIWAGNTGVAPWPNVALAAALLVATYAIVWYVLSKKLGSTLHDAFGRAAVMALFLGHVVAMVAGRTAVSPLFGTLLATHAILLLALLAIAWHTEEHALVAIAVPVTALAAALARTETPFRELTFAGVFYAIFVAYPLLLGKRAEKSIYPYLAAVLAGVPFFFFARDAMMDAGLDYMIGVLPVGQAALMMVLMMRLLRIESPGRRELGRLALVAGAALAFITVAIPLQLDKQWITIAWALEGAALVWLYTKIAHRGLLLWSGLLLSIVFVRLVFNPAVFSYHAASHAPIFNWYLYTYLVSAVAFFVAAYYWPRNVPPGVSATSAAGTVLLFFLLNIEIADFYSTGPTLTFNFLSSSLAQDLTYTIGWALFSIGMLIAGIFFGAKPVRVAAIILLAATILKCFLHDLGRLGGLYRVGSLLGLALSLVIVGVLLQKFVLSKAAPAKETV